MTNKELATLVVSTVGLAQSGARALVQPTARITGILFCVLAASCATVKEQAPPELIAQTESGVVNPSLDGSNPNGATAAEPPQPTATEQAAIVLAPPVRLSQSVIVSGDSNKAEPAANAPTRPAMNRSAVKAAPLPARAPAKAAISPPAIKQPQNSLPAVAKNPDPPLDVAGLTARLRDTPAIGLFSKLALKNQMDDLIKQFRAHYQSGQKTSVAPLRQPYDMLVLKVLALVQDKDPALARSISGSREAIWGILADPKKFNSVT